jgi:transcriptional regulator with XRE-family HTH domain
MKLRTDEVRRLRRIKDFSQDYTPDVIGLLQSQYSRIENGECAVALDKLRSISDILGVNPLDLIDFGQGQAFFYCNQSGNIETINNHNDFTEERKSYLSQIEDLKRDKKFLMEQIELLKELKKNKKSEIS